MVSSGGSERRISDQWHPRVAVAVQALEITIRRAMSARNSLLNTKLAHLRDLISPWDMDGNRNLAQAITLPITHWHITRVRHGDLGRRKDRALIINLSLKTLVLIITAFLQSFKVVLSISWGWNSLMYRKWKEWKPIRDLDNMISRLKNLQTLIWSKSRIIK